MTEITFTPSDFVAVFNQTIEHAYPIVVIEGELANFRVAKNRWVYFDLKDEAASVSFFGSVYNLPGPLQDGLTIKVIGAPRLHHMYGFTINFEAITPVGKGSLKKAADLLFKKLEAEGLFALERKRVLPTIPVSIGLITAQGSAAYSDFIKILNERWGGVDIYFRDVYVQGEQAPLQIVTAIEHFNQAAIAPEVLVITRGGGNAGDLSSFNDERVVRAVAASRVPTLIAIGHEVDISLAELASDQRASTPSNAAQIIVPDRSHVLSALSIERKNLEKVVASKYELEFELANQMGELLKNRLKTLLTQEKQHQSANKKLISIFNPYAALKRGYAIIVKNSSYVKSVKQVANGDRLGLKVSDGTINVVVSNK